MKNLLSTVDYGPIATKERGSRNTEIEEVIDLNSSIRLSPNSVKSVHRVTITFSICF